jgi:hypothetical protein
LTISLVHWQHNRPGAASCLGSPLVWSVSSVCVAAKPESALMLEPSAPKAQPVVLVSVVPKTDSDAIVAFVQTALNCVMAPVSLCLPTRRIRAIAVCAGRPVRARPVRWGSAPEVFAGSLLTRTRSDEVVTMAPPARSTTFANLMDHARVLPSPAQRSTSATWRVSMIQD